VTDGAATAVGEAVEAVGSGGETAGG